jgi:EamA domain-containing membrane protein RarD
MNNRIKGIEWIAVALMLIGVVLKWIHIDDRAILLNTGFIAFGALGLLRGIQAKYHKQFTVDTLRLLLSAVVIILALGNLNGERNQTMLAINILLLIAISMRKDLFSKRHA